MNVGNLEIRLIADMARLRSDMNKASTTVNKSVRNMQRSLGVLRNSFAGLAGALAVRKIVEMADSYTKLNAQLRIATDSQEEFIRAATSVNQIATKSQSDIGAIGSTYARLSLALKDVGATQKQVSNVTETLALALKVNGATAEETASVMLQLSQAFGKGKLDGDEFRSAMEAAPNVMRELADSMGVPFGALKDLARQGEITSEVMLTAFNNPELLESLNKQAAATRTLGGAVKVLMNEFSVFIGNVVNKTGAVDIFTAAIDASSQALRSFNDLLQTGKLRLESFLPAYEKYRQKMDKDLGLGFSFAPTINDKISPEDFGALSSEKARQYKRTNELLSKVTSSIKLQSAAISEQEQLQKDALSLLNSGAISQSDYNAIIKDTTRQIELLTRVTKKHNVLSGLSSDGHQALNELQELNLFEQKVEDDKRIKAAERREKERKAQIESDKKLMALRQKKANENFKAAQDAHKKIEQERRRDYERTGDILSRSLTDALFRGFESGKSFADNFIDTLKNTFKTLVLQPLVRFVVDSSGITRVLSSLTGSVSSGGGSGGGGSLTNLLGSVKSTFSDGTASLTKGIETLGSFISNGNGGFMDSVGGFMGQYAGQIASYAPYVGAVVQAFSGDVQGAAFTAAGAAIGSIIPGIGTAIGAMIGSVVGGLFGGDDPPPRTVTPGSARTVNGVTKVDGALGGVFGQFTSTLNTISELFGKGQSVSASGYYSGRDGGSGYGLIDARQGGKQLFYSHRRDKDAYGEASAKQWMIDVLGKYLRQSILKSDASQGVKRLFRFTNDTKHAVSKTYKYILQLYEGLKGMPAVFDKINEVLDTNSFKINIKQAMRQYAATEQFVKLFYSEEENFQIFTNKLTDSLAKLNQVLPATREEYRALIDNFEIVSKATSLQYTALAELAPVMDQYFDYLEKQKDSINEVNKAVADNLDKNLFSTYADYVSAQANALAGNDFSQYMYKPEGVKVNEELRNEIKLLRESEAETRSILQASRLALKKMATIMERQDGEGLPPERDYALV